MTTVQGRRATVGAIVVLAWVLGLLVARPVVGDFALVPLAQRLILAAPGWLSTWAIETFGFLAQPFLVATVIVGSVLVGGLVGGLLPEDRRYAIGGFAALALVTLGLFHLGGTSLGPRLVVGLALAIIPPVLVAISLVPATEVPDRREFLKEVGGVTIIGTVALGALWALLEGLLDPGASERVGEPLAFEVSPPTGDSRFDFAGMPAAVTSPSGHYVVDINISNPRVDPESWRLEVDGLVANPYQLTYDELLEHPAVVEQTTTMICISNQVGGDLIGTGHWVGVPLSALIERAEPATAASTVATHAVDGYSEDIPLELVEREDILIAFGMGDRTLETEHGFPARLLIPGRYGMKMTKWLDRIEVREGEHEAYWQARGWDEEAVVNTMAYIRGAARDGDVVTLGGVAFGGLETGVEEIASVEVSLDGGETWIEAELEEQLAPHAWRRWRYAFEEPNRTIYEVVCRAIRVDGTIQTAAESGPHPGGATGWHYRTIEV